MPEQEVNKDYLDQVSAARYEAETFLQMHPEFFSTRANGDAIVSYMQEKNLKLNANNFEFAFEKLKSQGKLLPGKETLALMGSEEFKQFAKTHGTPVRDEFGRVSYELPDAYLTDNTESYNRPRQSSTVEPVADRFPQDANKTFTPRQLASFSADRLRAFYERTGQWGK
jgi:hypothetical protein